MSLSTAATRPARRGRPPKIERHQVVDAAVELAESEGLDSLSLRAVAAKLDVAHVTLYRHIGGIEELIDLVVAAIVEQTPPKLDWPSDWEGVVLTFAHSLRAQLLDHPVILQAYQRRPSSSARTLSDDEHVLSALRKAGLDDDAALDVWVGIYALVMGFVAVEYGRAAPHVTHEQIRQDRERVQELIESDPDDFPTLREFGGEITWRFNSEQFDRTLKTFIAALRGPRPIGD